MNTQQNDSPAAASAGLDRPPRHARGIDHCMRRMALADLDEVVRIEREIYPFPWTVGNFRDSLRAGYLCWVMSDQGVQGGTRSAVLGYCVLMQVLDEAHLMNLSVAATAQRNGHGRRLLLWLLDLARQRGARGMFLEVRPSNQGALDLYLSEGFERIGLRRNYYPNGVAGREDAIVMRRDLDRRESRSSDPAAPGAHS